MRRALKILGLLALGFGQVASGQTYGEPDRGEPGDEMIQAYLARVAETLHGSYLDGIANADDWTAARPEAKTEYMSMLGLDPLPERTPLEATVTGTVEGEGFVVEKLHYQSVPGLYVTANLYRPATVEPGTRLPAVLYVCGHSGMGRDGNKTAFQSHGIWLARHGYICLMLDTLQLGEIAGIHHGTYREGRWWWHSRGYTSAGVECWNGVRGIDYLLTRADVDPERLAVTGISGGGAATFWIAAADDRIDVAIPVSGMADLPSYVTNRTVNGHCDCMFLYNTFEWPWAKIAGLIAPRPMLFVNSDADPIFPMDANERVIARLERLYSYFGAGDDVDAVVSVGGHAYRGDIRRAVYRFLNAQLKGDAHQVTDSEVDVVAESGAGRVYPIEPERLRVFPTDADVPDDALNAEIDQHFVPTAIVELPTEGAFPAWREGLLAELRRQTFRSLPEKMPPARVIEETDEGSVRLETEEGIIVPLQQLANPPQGQAAKRVLLILADTDEETEAEPLAHQREGDVVYRIEPRGVGATRWTRKNPPNYVDRAHVLLGRTVDSGRVRDIAATARYLRSVHGDDILVAVAGSKAAGVLGAYAALLEPAIGEVIVVDPPTSHQAEGAPALLNVLRVLDIPEALGMIAPRNLTLEGATPELTDRLKTIFQRAGAADRLQTR